MLLKLRMIKERRWTGNFNNQKQILSKKTCMEFPLYLQNMLFQDSPHYSVLPCWTSLKISPNVTSYEALPPPASTPSSRLLKNFVKTIGAHQWMAIYLPIWPASTEGNYIIHFLIFSAQLPQILSKLFLKKATWSLYDKLAYSVRLLQIWPTGLTREKF